MFEFLTGKKNHFIGVDFGTSSIKVVELSYKNQKANLENYGTVDLKLESHEDETGNHKVAVATSYEQKLNQALKNLLKKMRLKSGRAYVSIPGFSGLITIIDLPEMQNEELTKAIQFEAHKYIPSSLDEVAMSWEIIEHFQVGNPTVNATGTSVGSKRIKVLLVAAPKRDIERYDRLVSGSELDVNAIELETFSIARALADENGAFFIIDIGARATNIILVEKGIIRVNRNIDAGGSEITSAIAESMGVSHLRAEAFKSGDKDFLNGTESSLVIPVLELINSEALRILNSYRDKNKNLQLNAVYLSGGTAKMKGLVEYFSRTLNTNVQVGDPWRAVEIDPKLRKYVAKLGSSFTVAIGLALRGVEEYKRQ